jgi:CPA1 family monovalent cation:H+ antiporter
VPSDLSLVALFSIATAVALVARRLEVPYTVSLVLAGLVLGPTHLVTPPRLGQEMLYSLFLPGLLFEASYHLAPEELKSTKTRVVALAVPGVVVGMLLTAGMLAVAGRTVGGEPLPFRYALVFAAIVAATDPIAVVALFKELGAPRALSVLIEAESLLNDGTAIVLFSVVMAMVTGGEASWVGGAGFFFRVVAIGVAVGLAFGAAVSLVMKRLDDPMLEITLTTIAAYGSFAVAEHVHGSGVLATVTAGVICGGYAARVAMTERSRQAVAGFWEYVAFALNSVVFLLVGFTVDARALLAHWDVIAIAFVVSVVARAAVVYLVSFVLRRTRERMPWSWSAVLTWGGLRGSLSMVLALALPGSFPHRESIVTMTFGVVILSLFVQGLSIARLLRWLGIQDTETASGASAGDIGPAQ